MHKQVSFFTALLLLLTGATETFAAAETYECRFATRSSRGPVPETIRLRIDPDASFASVQDAFTKQLFPGPLSAKYKQISARQFTVKWQLVGLAYKGSETRVTSGMVDYKLRIRRPEMTAKITGVSREYYSDIYGEGRCARLK